MKFFHHVTISVFSREESLSFLDMLLPISQERFYQEQFEYDSDMEHTKVYVLRQAKLKVTESTDTNMKIYKFKFYKQSDVKGVFDTIVSKISEVQKELFQKEALKHVDEDGNMFLRLERSALQKEKFVLTTGGDCVHFVFSIAAFPKNQKTIRATVQTLLTQAL